MGLFSVVANVLGEVICLDAPPATGNASASVRPLIVDLRKVPSTEIRDGSSAEYLEVVLECAKLEEFTRVLDAFFGPPAKPFGQRPRFDRPLRQLVQSRGGINKDQCLYLRGHEDQYVAFAALWPWGDSKNTTLKVGVYRETLPSVIAT